MEKPRLCMDWMIMSSAIVCGSRSMTTILWIIGEFSRISPPQDRSRVRMAICIHTHSLRIGMLGRKWCGAPGVFYISKKIRPFMKCLPTESLPEHIKLSFFQCSIENDLCFCESTCAKK